MVHGLYEGYSKGDFHGIHDGVHLGMHKGLFGGDRSLTYFTCPEYKAVLQKAINLGFRLPSINQQILQDALMRTWIACGAFAKADLIYLLANDAGLDFGRINWKNPDRHLLTNAGAAGSIVFVPNYGPYGRTDIVAWGSLLTGWSPSMGVNFTLNSNCVISSTLGGYAASGMHYRAGAAPEATLMYSFDNLRVIHNNNAGASNAGESNSVNWINRRTAANAFSLSNVNAGAVANEFTSTLAPVSLSTFPYGLIGDPFALETIYTLSAPMDSHFVGGALTDPEVIIYDTALKNYLSSIRYAGWLIVSGNYTVPAGITELFIECFGAGGAGRGYSATATTTGAGGGGGGYSASIVQVVPGQVIPYIIPAGGVAGPAAGGNGGDTSWNGGQVLAKGGQGGQVTGNAGGQGGQASAGVGQIKFSGGTGGNGGPVLNASTGTGASGASSTGNGLNGVDGLTGSALFVRPQYNVLGPCAPGYSQNNTANNGGGTGMVASGGGGARRTSTTKTGGVGGRGWIRISAPKQY